MREKLWENIIKDEKGQFAFKGKSMKEIMNNLPPITISNWNLFAFFGGSTLEFLTQLWRE
jgi:hypothetical protein